MSSQQWAHIEWREADLIKGSLSSSWMNSPIPSLLLPLWQNESLCKTIGMKIYVTCTFIHMKIKSFSCETFSTIISTRSKEANGNSEVEVKSACICMWCQAVHQASTFCSMKWLEVFLLPAGWDASPSQGYLQHLICQYLFIHLSGY